MSGKQHFDAKLKGYNPPVFPQWIEELNRLVNGFVLQKVGGSINGFLEKTRPRTSDGYGWFWGLKFSLGLGKRVLVAFPWSQDWERTDGLELDRSIAVYVTRDVIPEELNSLLAKLIDALRAA